MRWLRLRLNRGRYSAEGDEGMMVKRILIPSGSFEDWRQFLTRPDRHWKPGFSAMTLARSWEAARGFPSEVRTALDASGSIALRGLDPVVIVPEYKVALPGGTRPSQTDVLIVARGRESV